MPVTTIHIRTHYSAAQEVSIIEAVQKALLICLREEPFEHWGIRGGQAACDVELGFSTQIEWYSMVTKDAANPITSRSIRSKPR